MHGNYTSGEFENNANMTHYIQLLDLLDHYQQNFDLSELVPRSSTEHRAMQAIAVRTGKQPRQLRSDSKQKIS